jgi:hypothetical protein
MDIQLFKREILKTHPKRVQKLYTPIRSSPLIRSLVIFGAGNFKKLT